MASPGDWWRRPEHGDGRDDARWPDSRPLTSWRTDLAPNGQWMEAAVLSGRQQSAPGSRIRPPQVRGMWIQRPAVGGWRRRRLARSEVVTNAWGWRRQPGDWIRVRRPCGGRIHVHRPCGGWIRCPEGWRRRPSVGGWRRWRLAVGAGTRRLGDGGGPQWLGMEAAAPGGRGWRRRLPSVGGGGEEEGAESWKGRRKRGWRG